MVFRYSISVMSVMIGVMGAANLCSCARGGVLSGLPAIYGPGTPQGAPMAQTVNVNNDNAGAGNPNRISLLGITILGLDPIDLSVPVANSPGTSGTTEYFIELGNAANMTGAAWNGFVIELGSGIGSEFSRLSSRAIPGVSGLDFDTPNRDPAVSSPSFLNITHGADVLTFTGGIVDVGEVAFGQNFSIDVPDTTLLLSTTYDFTIRLHPMPVSGIAGDFDLDGNVDGRDFLIWQRNPNIGELSDWQENYPAIPIQPGDFDRDGDVDGRDFLFWQRNLSLGSLTDWRTNYGNGTPLATDSITVPEPIGILLLVAAVLPCVVARDGRLV